MGDRVTVYDLMAFVFFLATSSHLNNGETEINQSKRTCIHTIILLK